jgi:hypothetical protein
MRTLPFFVGTSVPYFEICNSLNSQSEGARGRDRKTKNFDAAEAYRFSYKIWRIFRRRENLDKNTNNF